MPWNCLCSSSKKSKKSKYNENIKNHNDVPENTEPEKKRKPKFYTNLRLDQCEKNPKTNNSSSLDSQFDQKSINELNEHLYDSYDTLPNLNKNIVNVPENNKNYLNVNQQQEKQRSMGKIDDDDNILRPKHLILCLSNENLPFIDSDSPGCSHYNDRIIEMMPRNLLMSSSMERQNNSASEWEKLHHMQKTFPTHKYIEIDVMDAQICQKCHKHLSFKKTYKCTLCDFICHQICAVDKSGSYEDRQQQLERNELHNRPKTPTKNQLCYVTERILAAVLPTKDTSAKINDLFLYDENGNRRGDKHETDLLQMLEQKHGKNFRLFDLESCIPTISLEKLCELCKHIESWLNSGHNKIVVLQDRESFQRVGASVAAYLHYQKICSTNLAPYSIRSNSSDPSRNIQDLDEYSMQKFLDDIVGPITEPALKRYLEYFIGLLSGEIKINSQPLYLRFIKMESPPCMHHKISHHENEWSSFIKVFEGEKFVFISDIYIMPISTKQFIYEIKNPLNLRGDIFVHFFQIHNKSRQTELISTVQFHTCAITRNEVEFHKSDISFPRSDEKFPTDHKITLIFNKNADPDNSNRSNSDVLMFQNPLIRKEPISNFSSIADLSQYAQHTHGPVDGSLYATIAKAAAANNSNHADNELTVQNIQTIETRLNTPPTSKNSRILSTILEWDNIRNGGENGGVGEHNNGGGGYMNTASLRTRQEQPRSFVKSPLMRSYDSGIYSHEVTNKNNTSSALSWHDGATSPTTANNCHVELDNLLSEMLLTVETLPDISYSNSNTTRNKQIEVFSMKRSNANERTSPHRTTFESNTINTNANNQEFKRSHVQHMKNYNLDTFGYSKNNQDIGETSSITTTTLTPTESRCNTPAMSDHQGMFKAYQHHDELYYDTDTQMQLHGGRQRQFQLQHIDNTSRKEYEKQTENLLQSSSQSNSYMEVLRSENRSGDRPDSNIPYHAREYSKPFSYGIPGEGRMMKMQTGLSSPSMVRKALNVNGTSGRKTPVHEFEERAKYGRYVENKYTIGDKTPENNLSVFDNNKEFDYRNRSENQRYKDGASFSIENSDVESAHYFEPLRRSNTMDGSFGRSGYASDGGSSQTWLQVQQQRLRAKRAQRPKEVFDFTDGASRRSQTLSPVRNYNTLAVAKEPKFVTIKRTTEQVVSKPYKNDYLESNPFDYHNRTASHSRSYNEKFATINNMARRNMPITSTPYEAMDHINNNTMESTSEMDALDNILESIAFENFTTNIHLSEMVNGVAKESKVNLTSNDNINISNKTDTLNRFFDNLINFNRECEKANIRKSESSSDHSSSPDHQNNNNKNNFNGRVPYPQTRNESVSSYRSETETEVSRPETPAFPVTPRTPIHFGSTSTLPPKSPTLQRRDLSNRIHEVANVNETVSTYTSRRNSSNSAISNANSEPFEIAPHHVKFARDSSRFWYKPALTREEAINLLRNAQPGTFVVRDSTTFANAFGLVVRVSQPPPGTKGQGGDELVRHFLVEPTVRGVRLKGCSNEPVFSSLSALIYQHSVTPLALPCRLILPERDIQYRDNYQTSGQKQIVSQGAACNVLYLFSVDTESLTGPQAVRKAIRLLFERRPLPTPTEVHFKVASQGITLTDNSRQLFFRKHYPVNSVTFFGLDPDDHRWSVQVTNEEIPVQNQHIFAFIAKKSSSSSDNQCHIFCELEARQPASAIVSFAQKVLLDEATRQQHAPAQI
ncbi:CLUMA_CG005661, isoform B [Clunio marinus]|uniref:CLUMA_CG005661, isoform B n=1 Tax=Clunio marinus TaxID=568069 RepID=A0A1J1I134_9DIPT|nr:CLUMA_CG005661, isoform B [Clunio marinus]